MTEKIVYTIEDYKTIDEEDCIVFQNMFNSEVPIIFERVSLEYAKRRLLKKEDKIRVITARNKTSECSKLVGLMIIRQTENENLVPWFSMFIRRNFQRKGIGTVFMNMAKELYDTLHGWCTPADGYEREDGSIYPSPLVFYQKHGFEIIREEVNYKEGLDLVEITGEKTIE